MTKPRHKGGATTTTSTTDDSMVADPVDLMAPHAAFLAGIHVGIALAREAMARAAADGQ